MVRILVARRRQTLGTLLQSLDDREIVASRGKAAGLRASVDPLAATATNSQHQNPRPSSISHDPISHLKVNLALERFPRVGDHLRRKCRMPHRFGKLRVIAKWYGAFLPCS